MNKKIRNSFGLVILLSSVVFLNSCSDPEEKPNNVITDADGLKIDLKWSTGGTESAAKTDTDLDLFIYEGNTTTEVASSESGASFETVYLNADNADTDGTYTIAVYSYNKVGKATSYTVTVDGETTSNPYTFNSTFAKDDTYHEIKVLTVVKAGSKYTITPVN